MSAKILSLEHEIDKARQHNEDPVAASRRHFNINEKSGVNLKVDDINLGTAFDQLP